MYVVNGYYFYLAWKPNQKSNLLFVLRESCQRKMLHGSLPLGGATTFACKSQECVWQDWYI